MEKYECEYCKKKFDSKQALSQHKNDKHPEKIKPEIAAPVRKIRLNRMIFYAVLIILVLGIGYWVYSSLFVKPAYIPLTARTEHFKGLSSASVILTEFSDFQCSACAAAFPEVKKLMDSYGDKIKFIYKHFPLVQIHTKAFKAAEASECAADQGKFWEYHDKLFENRKLDIGDLKRYAKEIGLNTALFDTCLDSSVMAFRVRMDSEEAQKLFVRATPTFFVNGEKYEGVIPFNQFRLIIDKKLSE